MSSMATDATVPMPRSAAPFRCIATGGSRKRAREQRADRIEGLAAQLSLPRAALSDVPDAGQLLCAGFEPVTQPFADPDPFHELAFPSALEAKRAIADHLGLPLAKLSPEQLEALNALLAHDVGQADGVGPCAAVISSPSIEDKTMLSDVMEHFGLRKSLHQVDYFDTEHHQQVLKDLKAAIYEGGIVALTGVVGSGKTLLLWRMQDHLRHEGQIEVAESLVFDVPRVTLSTLKLALYYDLATEKDGDLTGKPEKSERALMKVMRRCEKPIAFCIDDAHDLHGQTLRGLKQLIEKTRRRAVA